MTQYFIDTNILWWYFVKTSKFHKIIKKFLDPLIIVGDNSFFVNEFVMIELFHLLIKKQGKRGFELGMQLLESDYPFFHIHYDVLKNNDLHSILQELFLYGTKTTIGGRDSSIIHSMNKHSIENIITYDTAFKEVRSIMAIYPLMNT